MKQTTDSIPIFHKQKMKQSTKERKRGEQYRQLRLATATEDSSEFTTAGSHFVTYQQCFNFPKQTTGRES